MTRIEIMVRHPAVATSGAPGTATSPHGTGRAGGGEVVVPLDGGVVSERALPVAIGLARELEARLHLVVAGHELSDEPPAAYLQRLAATIDGAAPGNVDTDVALDQDPVAAIVELAARPGAVVCMATQARGRLSTAMHPSVATDVAEGADGAVVLVGPRCAIAPLGEGPVLVAHDGSTVATEAVGPLVDLAIRLRRPVEVVRVAAAPSAHGSDHPYADTEAAIAPLLERARLGGVHASERIVFGTDVTAALLHEATRIGASAIATVMHRRTRAERLRDGSTTVHLARDATVPVVTRHHDAV